MDNDIAIDICRVDQEGTFRNSFDLLIIADNILNYICRVQKSSISSC